MSNQWKLQRGNSIDFTVSCVTSALISSTGVANGRNIPVVIVKTDPKNVIDDIISIHETIPCGHCDSQWGMTVDRKKVLLSLEFKDPIECKFLIAFDFLKYAAVVDQIIYSQCMYLMTGTPGMKLSENLDKDRILLEIPSESFSEEWERIYRKEYVKYLRQKYQISRKESIEIFDKLKKELNDIKTLRLK